jgi:hypothetical protein
MSIDVMNRIWWRKDLAMTEKIVALAIADTGDDDGECYISVERIMHKCGCTRRTVQNSLRSLEGKGLLRTFHRKDRVSQYFFVMENMPLIEKPAKGPKDVKLTKAQWDAAEQDLFNRPPMTGAADAPLPKMTGASDTGTGAFNSATGAADAPRTSRTTSRITPDSDSGDFKSPGASLTEFVEIEWHKLKEDFAGIADIRKIDEALGKQITLRARQHAQQGEEPVDVWTTVFREIRGSEFLTGRVPPGPGRDAPFKLSLGWLCQTQKFREVINGKYASDRGNKRTFTDDGRRLGPTDQAVAGTIERMRAARKRG